LPPISTCGPACIARPWSSTRTVIVALLPLWQMVLISLISSAQASRDWLPSNSSPRKSVRSP